MLIRPSPPRATRPAIRARALALAGSLTACDGAEPTEQTSVCGPTAAQVTRVIDGDTVELVGGERVRYLLIDTPEITGGKDECYGAEARDFNRDTVEGKEVTLSYDERECEDTYGRLLAFVALGSRDINALLLDRGFARVLFIAPSGEDRVAEYDARQMRAQAGLAGLWGACETD